MPGTFTCRHCGETLPRNPRLKKSQKYCSAIFCQQARKNAWGRKEYRTNKIHRKKRLESQKVCYAKRPGHAYQAVYREKHPEYDQRNRELQRKRNNRRSKDGGSMILNTDPIAQVKLALYFYRYQNHQPVLPRIEVIPTLALDLSLSELRIMNVSRNRNAIWESILRFLYIILNLSVG